MPPRAALPQPIAEALAAGSILLTPHQRAAHALARAAALPDAQIFTFESWLRQLWHSLLLAGKASLILLNRSQEHVLWRDLIAGDAETSGLSSPDALAELAATAWRQLHLHEGQIDPQESFPTPDREVFRRWAREFDRRTAMAGYLTGAQLPSALHVAVRAGWVSLPGAGVALVDFPVGPDWAPSAQVALIEAFARRGTPVQRIQTAAPATHAHIVHAPDPAAELIAAAHWIRRRLENHPEARVAVVVPNLEQQRPRIRRVFGQVLAPELNRYGVAVEEQAGPFEFSLGVSLAATPQCFTALSLLRLSLGPLAIPVIANLLLSPFFGFDCPSAEQLATAEFDLSELRETRLLRQELALEDLVRMMEFSPRAARLVTLRTRLDALRQAARARPGTQSHAAWSDHFRALLAAAGWSGTVGSSSPAFQTHRRWESALDELATLDFNGSRATAAGALAALERIAEQIVFAPQSRDAPVQILGPLELGGLPLMGDFDAIWFLSAGDLTWPVPVSPSPLLAFSMARALGLPGTDAARDHTAACNLTRQIAGFAPEAIFSYALETEEGRQRPSPALTGLGLEAFEPDPLPGPAEPLPTQIVPDDLALPPLPDRVIPGGAQVLALQAACGFRAFAERRLFSAEPTAHSPGMDARDRGSLVHKVMELLWTRLSDQLELRALSATDRAGVLDAAIDEALARPLRHARSEWDRAYLETQRQRLRRLLDPWLDYELHRPAFAVSRSENTLEATIGPLRLSLRVDRTDETEAGTLVLDYKTGDAAPSQWQGVRPDAPQLPLYAILTDPPPAGVAFALLRPGDDLCMKGFADSPEVFGKPSRMDLPFEDQLKLWREVLSALAEAFAAGIPIADPKAYPGTCSYCAQRILCRLNPARLTEICDEDPVAAEDPALA